jgi:hypothetical protein
MKKFSFFSKTRREAFRKAKRNLHIPVSTQPREVVRPETESGDEEKLDTRNVRLYIFKLLGLEHHIREDKATFYSDGSKQKDHFNAGKSGGKLRAHHYFDRKNRRKK